MDMQRIKHDFSLNACVQPPWVDLGAGAKAKIQLIEKVMLHIKLKEMTQTLP